MKKREPAVKNEIDRALALDLNESLNDGDTIGVWTFNETVHAGEFPLQIWKSGSAAAIAGNITTFIGRQRYSRRVHFDALAPLLNRLVENSQRLTIMIFCDGEQDVQGTPYDIGINQVFRRHLSEREKSKQPFVITLRSQLGKFVGCTVSFPPSQISLPGFPPLPKPTNATPPVAKTVTNAPPPEPKPKPPQAPPLIIIWTNHPSELPAPSPEVTEQQPVAAPPTQTPVKPTPVVTNPPLVAATSSNATTNVEESKPSPLAETPVAAQNELPAPTLDLSSNQTAVVTNTEQMSAPQTNIIATSTVNPTTSSGNMLIFGFGLLAGAGVMATVIWRRARNKSQPSLITRSMEKK